MSGYVLFVTPGVGPAGAAAAKARYEGEDEAYEGLTEERIRAVADELMKGHGLVVDPSGDAAEDTPPGVDLEEGRDSIGFDVRVDRWGATIVLYVGDSPDETAG